MRVVKEAENSVEVYEQKILYAFNKNTVGKSK